MDEERNDLLLKVNKQTFHCSQKAASESSPLIRDYLATRNTNFENSASNDVIFDTTVPDISSDDDLSILNEIINNQKIEITKENYAVSLKIGQHFLMENIVEQCKTFNKYETLINFLGNDKNFQNLLELEKVLLEMNEENIISIVDDCINILSIMPLNCFYNFIIHIFMYSSQFTQKSHLLIQLLEKIEESITGIISSFIRFILNNICLKKSSQKKSNYIKRISLFVYELCSKVNSSFINEDITIKYSNNFCVPELLTDLIFFDKEKHTIRIDKNNIINHKSNLNNSLSCIVKEINDIFNGISDNNNDQKNDNINSKISILYESIQNDDVDFLQNNIQELEKDSFITPTNQSINCSLLEYSAFFGSIKCFLFMINNNEEFDKNRLPLFAIAGGNPEIIHFCERNNCVFEEKSLKIAIICHRNFLIKWLIARKHIEPSQQILKESIKRYNIDALNYCINRKTLINRIILDSISAGNYMLFSSFFDFENTHTGLSLDFNDGCKTALHIACEKNIVEIVKLLLKKGNIDINAIYKVY